MQNAAAAPPSSRSWLTILHLRSLQPGERVTYEAQLAIPEDRVVDALAALIENHRRCRGYAVRNHDDPHRHLLAARKSLIDALNRLGHEATRATEDIGIRIVYGSGDARAVQTVLDTLEPFCQVQQPITWQRAAEPAAEDVTVTGHGRAARTGVTIS